LQCLSLGKLARGLLGAYSNPKASFQNSQEGGCQDLKVIHFKEGGTLPVFLPYLCECFHNCSSVLQRLTSRKPAAACEVPNPNAGFQFSAVSYLKFAVHCLEMMFST
jgi:hypothetical protein